MKQTSHLRYLVWVVMLAFQLGRSVSGASIETNCCWSIVLSDEKDERIVGSLRLTLDQNELSESTTGFAVFKPVHGEGYSLRTSLERLLVSDKRTLKLGLRVDGNSTLIDIEAKENLIIRIPSDEKSKGTIIAINGNEQRSVGHAELAKNIQANNINKHGIALSLLGFDKDTEDFIFLISNYENNVAQIPVALKPSFPGFLYRFRYQKINSQQVFRSEMRGNTDTDESESKQGPSVVGLSFLPLTRGESAVFAVPMISENTDYKIGISYSWNYDDMPLIEKTTVQVGSKLAKLKGEFYRYESPIIWCDKTVRWKVSD